MADAFIELTSLEQVEALLTESASRPVLILKHSRSCGSSARAFDELVEHLGQRSPTDVTFALVTVQSHRELASAIGSRLGVRHETPQAILVDEGKVVWSASHFRVTADAIEAAIKRLPARTP